MAAETAQGGQPDASWRMTASGVAALSGCLFVSLSCAVGPPWALSCCCLRCGHHFLFRVTLNSHTGHRQSHPACEAAKPTGVHGAGDLSGGPETSMSDARPRPPGLSTGLRTGHRLTILAHRPVALADCRCRLLHLQQHIPHTSQSAPALQRLRPLRSEAHHARTGRRGAPSSLFCAKT